MERFVRKENVKHYGDLLREAKSEGERQRIRGLLDEELKKQEEAGDVKAAESRRSRARSNMGRSAPDSADGVA